MVRFSLLLNDMGIREKNENGTINIITIPES